MATVETPAPVTLIPARPQTLWGAPAVANFAGGGLGAGFYVAATVAAGFGSSTAVTIASWLAPALVLAGFAAVAAEAGRPLRGPRVFIRARTSWMSRELWLGSGFALLAAGDLAFHVPGQRLAATAAAVAFVLAQGFILRDARGIAAWAVPVMPLLFLSSGLVSGAGLLTLLELAGHRVSPQLLGACLVLLLGNMLVWSSFTAWSTDAASADSVRPLREGRGMLAIVGGGYVAPSLLIALALTLPRQASPLTALGAALMVMSQLYLKAALILEAGQLKPVTLSNLRLARRAR